MTSPSIFNLSPEKLFFTSLIVIGITFICIDLWKWATHKPDPQEKIRSQKYQAVQKYIKESGSQLRDRYGRQKNYTPAQVKQSIQDIRISTAYDCYAFALYCSQSDFDDYHRGTGESCDYTSMRQDICDLFAPFFGSDMTFDACDILEISDRHYFSHAVENSENSGSSPSQLHWSGDHHLTSEEGRWIDHASGDSALGSGDFSGGDFGGSDFGGGSDCSGGSD